MEEKQGIWSIQENFGVQEIARKLRQKRDRQSDSHAIVCSMQHAGLQ